MNLEPDAPAGRGVRREASERAGQDPEAGAVNWIRRRTWPEAFVAAVWTAMLVAALLHVARCASVVPMLDDIPLVAALLGRQPVTLEWLWSLHNEHRLLLPRAIVLGLAPLFGGDVRSGMFFAVLLLGLAALAGILAARRIRGHTSALDAFFPLLWLHWGHTVNLLTVVQLTFALPSALCAVALAIVAGSPALDVRRAAGLGACVMALPLSGAAGAIEASALLSWMLLAGMAGGRSGVASVRRAGLVLVLSALAALALIGLYVRDFEFSNAATPSPAPLAALELAANFASLTLGPAAEFGAPFSVVLVVATVLVTILRLAAVVRSRPSERLRASGILAVAAAIVFLAVALGWSRATLGEASGFSLRYVTLASPLFACVFLAWGLYGSPALARRAQAALLLLACAALPSATSAGLRAGESHRALGDAIVADAEAGLSSAEIAHRHWRASYHLQRMFLEALVLLREARSGPFARASWRARIDEENVGLFDVFYEHPMRVSPPALVRVRRVDGRPVALAPPDAELEFRIPAGAREFRGDFGIAPEAYRRGTDGVRFRIELREENGGSLLLFERLLAPARQRSDRGSHSFCVAFPAEARGTLVLSTSNDPGGDRRGDLAYWTAAGFE